MQKKKDTVDPDACHDLACVELHDGHRIVLVPLPYHYTR